MNKVVLRVWTIYERPSDHPDWFVVRCSKVTREGVMPSPVASLAVDLEHARQAVPEGAVCIGRMPEDDPCIVEVWL